MKILLQIGLLVTLSFLIIQPANGQKLLKKLRDKAKHKVEKKLEDEADKKIDQGLDKVEDSLEKEDKTSNTDSIAKKDNNAEMQNRMQGMLKNFGMSGEPVPYNDNYNFDYLIQMHIESFNQSGEQISNGEFITHLDHDSKGMAYEVISGDMAKPGQAMFIIDPLNGTMIIMSHEKGKKTAIVYGIGSFFESLGTTTYKEEVDLSETPETYLANPNVKKTGKTKIIAGLKCEEYIYNDENTVSEIWITKDMKMNTQDYFGTLFKTSLYSHGMGWGYMMEVTSKNKDSGEKSIMKVTKVDKNSNVKFNLSEYQVTNLGSFQMPAETEE